MTENPSRRHLLGDAAPHIAGADNSKAFEEAIGHRGDGSNRCHERGLRVRRRRDHNPIVYDRNLMSEARADLVATPSQTVGPFFHFGLADKATLGCLIRPDTPGARISLQIRVFDGNGAPLPDALIELWQADAEGRYVRPADAQDVLAPEGFCGFGRLPTGADGACTFETIRPGPWRATPGSPKPRTSTCASLLAGCCGRSTRASTSPATSSSPPTWFWRRSRVAPAHAPCARTAPGAWLFDVCLQGDGETVSSISDRLLHVIPLDRGAWPRPLSWRRYSPIARCSRRCSSSRCAGTGRGCCRADSERRGDGHSSSDRDRWPGCRRIAHTAHGTGTVDGFARHSPLACDCAMRRAPISFISARRVGCRRRTQRWCLSYVRAMAIVAADHAGSTGAHQLSMRTRTPSCWAERSFSEAAPITLV